MNTIVELEIKVDRHHELMRRWAVIAVALVAFYGMLEIYGEGAVDSSILVGFMVGEAYALAGYAHHSIRKARYMALLHEKVTAIYRPGSERAR